MEEPHESTWRPSSFNSANHHGDTEHTTTNLNLKVNSRHSINMEEQEEGGGASGDLRRELTRLQEREALLTHLLCLEREKRVKAEQLVEAEHLACLELGQRLGRERKIVAAVRKRAAAAQLERGFCYSKDDGISLQEDGGELLRTGVNLKIQNGMEPGMEDGLHSSPAGSSQGSDSGLAMMSPMEADFSSSVFSQLTSDLQQMLGVGATKDSSLEQKEGLARAKEAIESDNSGLLRKCISLLDVDALANEGVELEGEGAELEEEGGKGTSLLELASECGRSECVKVLLDAGLGPNRKTSRRRRDGMLALHLAAKNGHHDTLVLLLKSRADPHLQDNDGRTALYLAVRGGHLSCVQTLLEFGAKVSTVTKQGETSLHAAVLANSPTILRNLIVQMRIVMETVEMTSVVNHCDSDGRTPLHLAASLGHKECAEVLCVRADIDTVKRDRWNRTPLDVATPDCKEILLNRESRQVVVYVESCGSSPVHSSSNLVSDSDYRTAIGRISILRHHKLSDLELLVQEAFKQYWNALKVFGNSRTVDDRLQESSLGQKEERFKGISFWEGCTSLNDCITAAFSLSTAFTEHQNGGNNYVNPPDAKESYLKWSRGFLNQCRSRTSTMDLTEESVLSYRVGSMSWTPGEIPSGAKLKTLFSLFAELERQQQQQHGGRRGKMARDELEEGERMMEVTISLKGLREGCLDQLAFDSMMPLYKLKEYANLIEEHKGLVIHGAQGSGKTYLALTLANHLKYKHGVHGTQVVHVSLHSNFQRDDLFRLLHINGLLVSASSSGDQKEEEGKQEGLNEERKTSTVQQRTFIVILDDLSKVAVPNVLAELLTCLTYRGAEHPLWISDVFSRDGGSLLYPCGHYYLQPHCYFITTQRTHSRGSTELVSIDHFPHITLDYHSEPSVGILRRQLTAKLIHCSLGDLPYNASFLPRLLLWSVDVWLLYNHFLLSLDLPELTCGIKNFLQCPLESKDPGVIVDWICSLWNFHLAPSIETMLQSDPRLSIDIVSPQFNGTVKSNQQKAEQHRYKALMQLLLACTRLVFLPTCPLQLEMRVKVVEQLSSRLEGLLSTDGGGESREKVDPLSNAAGSGTPPLPPHITNRVTPPTPGKSSQDRRGSGSLPSTKPHPPSSSSSSSSATKADNMVSYEDMIRNSPRNTPKMPRNRPPPLPQKTQSADAIEVVKKLQALTSPSPNSSPVTPAAAATTSSVVVSGRKPPTPTHTAALSVKKKRAPRSLSTEERSPRIMEGVKLREKSDPSRSKTLHKLRSKTIALFSKDGGYSTLPKLFRKGSRASLASLSEEDSKKPHDAKESHRKRPKSESQQLNEFFDMLSSASSDRYEEQRSPPPSSPPPEDLVGEGAGPGGEATDGGDDLDDIFDLATNMNSDRIEGQRSAGPSPIKQNGASSSSSPEKSKKKRKVAKYFLPTGSPFSQRKDRTSKTRAASCASPTNFSMPDLTVSNVESPGTPNAISRGGGGSGYFGSHSTSTTPNRIRARISSEVYTHGRYSHPRGHGYHHYPDPHHHEIHHHHHHQPLTQSASEGTRRMRSNSLSSESRHTVSSGVGGYSPSALASHFIQTPNNSRALPYHHHDSIASSTASYATDPIARRLLGHGRSYEQSIPSPLAISVPSVNHAATPTSPLATTAYSSSYQDNFYTESEASPYTSSHQHTQSSCSSNTMNTASYQELNGSPYISHQHTQSDSTTHTADEVADSSLLLQHNGQTRENFHHGTSGYPEGFSQGITSATMPLDMAPPPAPSSVPAKKKRQARSVENLKENDDDLGAFDLFRAASDGEINQSSSPSPRYQKEENYFQFKQNTQQQAPSTSYPHEEPKQLPPPPVSNGTKSENNHRGGTSITMMHCDYHSIYPEEKSANSVQSVQNSASTQSSVNNTTNNRVTSITMMHCNYHSIYPEEGTTAADHDQSPLSPTQGRSVSSTTDPAVASYDRDSSDQQYTPRRRSDTTSGAPYDLQSKRNRHDDLSDISPRRHSVTASDRGYYCNKSNSSVGSAASGTPSSSSTPTGSKVVARRARKSSDATNLLFSASLGFSNLLKAGSSRDRLQCNSENVAEM